MRLSVIVLFMLSFLRVEAQAPLLISYQAVARNAAGQPLVNSILTARFSIHSASALGPVEWQELQTVITNSMGLFTVQLGSLVGLNLVQWEASEKFMQVEVDLGNGYTDIGTQQMLSVPYALHAKTAANGISGVSTQGDSLYLADGSSIIVPGISLANSITAHTCGTQSVHNPNLNYGSMIDQAGNTYKTIAIGSQVWMAENLRTDRYRNGELITTGLANSAWQTTTSGAWASDPNVQFYECPYGRLYNWYAVADSRQLCPSGWHVPSDAEFTVLSNYLGGEPVAGGKMKTTGSVETSTGLWYLPNTGATNSSGLSVLPGGVRGTGGTYFFNGYTGYLWTSSVSSINLPWFRSMGNTVGSLDRSDNDKRNGMSVRCVHD